MNWWRGTWKRKEAKQERRSHIGPLKFKRRPRLQSLKPKPGLSTVIFHEHRLCLSTLSANRISSPSMATSLITPKKANTMHLQSTSISKVRVIVRARPFLPHEIASAKNGNPISCASVLDQDCESGEEVVVHLNDQETRWKISCFWFRSWALDLWVFVTDSASGLCYFWV